MLTDLPLSQLREYRSVQREPDDFGDFWDRTLDEHRRFARNPVIERTATPLTTLDVYDIAFPGYGGESIRAWLKMPSTHAEDLPVVVQYIGYGAGRGRPSEHLFWPSAGFAHLYVDTRGQGGLWAAGATGDSGVTGAQAPGFLTRGVEYRDTYYYRRVFTDAVMAVDVARTLPGVDPDRVIVHGGSQGGGIALAAAALAEGVAGVVAYVPFLCDFPRALEIHDSDPYAEVVRYLAVHRERVDSVMETLAYFDAVNFARRSSAPALFSVALMDPICKPSTVFGAFNAYAGPKSIEVWPHNGHEGGGADSDISAAEWASRLVR